jgi:hypothetical protein
MIRSNPFLTLALGGLLLAPMGVWAADPEPALEVDLGSQPTETPTPVPPTPTAVPTEVPTAAPTDPPTAGPTAQLTPAVSAVPADSSPAAATNQDLGDVRFDKGQAMPAEDGLMIIAPGAATAEDSLESFGIDSPFNWKNQEKPVLQPGKDADEESLELAAPESSDLKDRVRVENSAGDELASDADYDQVERAGLVVNASEYRVDGHIDRTKDGVYFAIRGTQVLLHMEPGRQVYPGSIYTVFREHGILKRSRGDQADVGMQLRNVGVLKVIRIEGDEVLARVEKQYDTILEGDLVRLRDPDRLRYYNSVRQGPPAASLELTGEVIGMAPQTLMARAGKVIYIDQGRAAGLAPGMKLTLSRLPEELGQDDLRSIQTTGRLGQVQIINTSRDSSVARVIRCDGEVRLGDQVQYR